MHYRTFQTLTNAASDAYALESDRGNTAEAGRLSKLLVDISRTALHFERLRRRFYRYRYRAERAANSTQEQSK